uniref:Uncharacterized protein n=1 Tax=hospital metagenome TaxID=1755691 RepID=A0A4P9D522_9ZZZZ
MRWGIPTWHDWRCGRWKNGADPCRYPPGFACRCDRLPAHTGGQRAGCRHGRLLLAGARRPDHPSSQKASSRVRDTAISLPPPVVGRNVSATYDSCASTAEASRSFMQQQPTFHPLHGAKALICLSPVMMRLRSGAQWDCETRGGGRRPLR